MQWSVQGCQEGAWNFCRAAIYTFPFLWSGVRGRCEAEQNIGCSLYELLRVER